MANPMSMQLVCRVIRRDTIRIIHEPSLALNFITSEYAKLFPSAACGWNPRQRRLIWAGAAYRLAAATLLSPLAHTASSLGYELDRVLQELDTKLMQRNKQARESIPDTWKPLRKESQILCTTRQLNRKAA